MYKHRFNSHGIVEDTLLVVTSLVELTVSVVGVAFDSLLAEELGKRVT